MIEEKIRLMKPCANCQRPISEDYRLGRHYKGSWFCSVECEREFFVECGERGGGVEPRKGE
ncbi:MAG: hypothetical protein J7J01_03430 [Methanophagales archaeon]|nr:hypothetical protein [Methanophagales archaeon]